MQNSVHNFYQQEYSSFIAEYPEFHNYLHIDELRKTEFARIDKQGQIYLDFTAGGLYSEKQINEHAEFLKNHLLGNPHSSNPPSLLATEHVESTRKFILEYFNALDDYYCVFTANASSALKIVGECYPFSKNSHFLLFFDNHNSVNGIREYAKLKNATFSYSPMHYDDLRVDAEKLLHNLSRFDNRSNKLFAFPAQSNVSGVKHDLEWVRIAQEKGWDVILDAAAFVPTNKLDLKKVQPEFVVMSFYKIFGYPTGLGALLIKKSAFNKLEKPWFAGGTVTFASVMSSTYFLAENHERFEDGTINYLNIPALKIGFELINKIGMEAIQKRIAYLTSFLLKELQSLRHKNGKNLVQIFGPLNTENRGGTIILNLFDKDGHKILPEIIEQKANQRNISLRTGCFCNPGINEINYGVTEQDVAQYFTSQKTESYEKIIIGLKRMRGVLRISLGLVSNFNDCLTFVNFCRSFADQSTETV